MMTPSGMSTLSMICDFFSTGRRLAMICSVDSLEVELPPFGVAAIDRDLLERLDELAGTLQIGDQLIGGVAAALQELVEPRAPQRTRDYFAAESSQRRAKLDATVRLMPIGLLTSCATPATSPPSAASFSAAIRFCCASRRSLSATRHVPSRHAAHSPALRLAMAFSRNTSSARAISPISSRALVPRIR